MLAYHNDSQLKQQFVTLIDAHAAADQLLQGTYWDGERGCAVGCSIASLRTITGRTDLDYDNHAVYEELLGVPRILARLEDGIFEGLPHGRAMTWPGEFSRAIPVGADLSHIWPQFAVWLLDDAEHGVIRYAKTDKQREAIRAVADLYRRQLEGVIIPQSEWKAAADAADAYAYAYAAAEASRYASRLLFPARREEALRGNTGRIANFREMPVSSPRRSWRPPTWPPPANNKERRAMTTIPTRTVTIPSTDNHDGHNTVTLTLTWVCPKCGGPRGEPYNAFSYDGSRRLVVDSWQNPCGHVDYYGDVRAEALASIRQIESRCTGDDPCDVHAPCPAHAELAAEFLAMPKTKAPSPQTDETEQREAKWFCQGIAPII